MGNSNGVARIGRRLVAVLLLGAQGACDGPFLAVEPGPGDLKGQWLVNESSSAGLGLDCPVAAHLRLRNEFPRRVRMVKRVEPAIEGKPGLKWKAYRKLPASLEPGATWEGVWLLTDALEPGRYEVSTGPGGEDIEAQPASLEIRNGKLATAERTRHQCVAARLTGEVDQVVGMLTREIEAGLAPPSTHLQLAELMESLGDREASLRQYEQFAQRVYGSEELPAWLRSRMTRAGRE